MVYYKSNIFSSWEGIDQDIVTFFKDSISIPADYQNKFKSFADYKEYKKELPLFSLYKTHGSRSNVSYFDDNSIYIITEFDLSESHKKSLEDNWDRRFVYMVYVRNVYRKICEYDLYKSPIFICYISPSQMGLRIIYKVSEPISNEIEYIETNKRVTMQLKKVFDQSNYFEIDTSKMGSNCAWFYNYTESNLYINTNAIAVKKEKIKKHNYDNIIQNNDIEDNSEFRDRVIEHLANLNGITDDYQSFIKMCYALKSAGFSYSDVDCIFQNSKNYNYKSNEYIYNTLDISRSGGNNFGYAVNILKNNNRKSISIIVNDIKASKQIKTTNNVLIMDHDISKEIKKDIHANNNSNGVSATKNHNDSKTKPNFAKGDLSYIKWKTHDLILDITNKVDWECYDNTDNVFVFNRNKDVGYYNLLTETEQTRGVTDIYPLLSHAKIKNVLKTVTHQSFRFTLNEDIFLKSRVHNVPFLNGIYDVKHGLFRSYTDNDFLYNPLPYSFESNRDTNAETFFYDLVSSWVNEENTEFFIMLLAYVLFIYPNTDQIWVNFYGHGQNGKGLCLWLLETILGKDNTTGVDLKMINRFTSSTFENKMLVVGRDSGNRITDEGVSIIKTFSGDDYIVIERKGKQPYDTPVVGKLVVSTNDLIKSPVKDSAWYRRIVPVMFPNKFAKNIYIKDQITENLPGIITLLCNKAHEIVSTQYSITDNFTKDILALKTRIEQDENPVKSWWEEEIKPDLNDKYTLYEFEGMDIKQLYSRFCAWYIDNFGEDTKIYPTMRFFVKDQFLGSTDFPQYFCYPVKKVKNKSILSIRRKLF